MLISLPWQIQLPRAKNTCLFHDLLPNSTIHLSISVHIEGMSYVKLNNTKKS